MRCTRWAANTGATCNACGHFDLRECGTLLDELLAEITTVKQSIPRRTGTRNPRRDERSTYNSVAPGWMASRFACNERPACEANDVSACDERVVYGAFIPSQNPRAGPPREALLSRCFLVTSLHQQRSDPLGLRPSGSFALVAGEENRLLRFDANHVARCVGGADHGSSGQGRAGAGVRARRSAHVPASARSRDCAGRASHGEAGAEPM